MDQIDQFKKTEQKKCKYKTYNECDSLTSSHKITLDSLMCYQKQSIREYDFN